LVLSFFLSSTVSLSWIFLLWIAIALPAVVVASKDPLAPALSVVDIAADGSSQDAVAAICRGSLLYPLPQALHGFGVVRPKARRRYRRQALENQRELLKRHLRQAQDQLRNLKRQLPKRRERLQKTQRLSVSEKKLITNQVHSLSNQVQNLEQMKKDLNETLQQRLLKIEHLELEISDYDRREHHRCLMLELDYPRRVRALDLQIKETAQEQLAQMRELYYDRIQHANDMAQRNVLEDMETKVQQATAALRVDLQLALKVERQNRKDAVEKQRVKQRLLAKALAMQESKYIEMKQQIAVLEEEEAHLEEMESNEQVDRQVQAQLEEEQSDMLEDELQQQAKREAELEEESQEQLRVVELLKKKERLEVERQEEEQALVEQQHRQRQQITLETETEQQQKRQADQLKRNLQEKKIEKERLIKERQEQEWQVLQEEDPDESSLQDEKETVVPTQQDSGIVSPKKNTPFQGIIAGFYNFFQQPKVNSPEPAPPPPPDPTQSKEEAPQSKPFEPAVYKFESFNRKVCWQPMTLPPPSVSKLSF
jgi:hypothetical protein